MTGQSHLSRNSYLDTSQVRSLENANELRLFLYQHVPNRKIRFFTISCSSADSASHSCKARQIQSMAVMICPRGPQPLLYSFTVLFPDPILAARVSTIQYNTSSRKLSCPSQPLLDAIVAATSTTKNTKSGVFCFPSDRNENCYVSLSLFVHPKLFLPSCLVHGAPSRISLITPRSPNCLSSFRVVRDKVCCHKNILRQSCKLNARPRRQKAKPSGTLCH